MDSDRYDFLNDRIDHTDGRIDDVDTRLTALESDKEVKKSRTLEWIVIGLIVIEILESIFIWYLSRHG